MLAKLNRKLFILALFSKILLGAENNRHGSDYAFLFLMTMTPYFSSATYTIEDDEGIDIDMSIGRFPLSLTLIDSKNFFLELEAEYAYQTTKASYPTFLDPGEYVDSKWDTYGFGLGLLYNYKISTHMLLRPNIRYAFGNLQNNTRYHGSLTKQIADQLDESHLFNWESNATILNIGLGWTYFFEMLDYTSNLRIDVNRVNVDSFNEDNEDVKFSEQANMAALRTDLVFPTGVKFWEEDLNLVVLLGTNYFFGENRRTLGYTKSYQAAIVIPFPVKWEQKILFDLKLGYQWLWAERMNGTCLIFGIDLN